jgi:hypothetical protein
MLDNDNTKKKFNEENVLNSDSIAFLTPKINKQVLVALL